MFNQKRIPWYEFVFVNLARDYAYHVQGTWYISGSFDLVRDYPTLVVVVFVT